LDRGIIFCSSYPFFYPKHGALRGPVKFGTTYAEITFFGWIDLIQKKVSLFEQIHQLICVNTANDSLIRDPVEQL